LKRNFSKLEILHQLPDHRLYHRRYIGFAPLVFVAMIYDFCTARQVQLYQVPDMATTPGSPAMVFGLDAASMRQQIEAIHDRGWLSTKPRTTWIRFASSLEIRRLNFLPNSFVN
jgi:hypothetical protein